MRDILAWLAGMHVALTGDLRFEALVAFYFPL